MSVDSWICFRWKIAIAFVHIMTCSLPLELVDEFWVLAHCHSILEDDGSKHWKNNND